MKFVLFTLFSSAEYVAIFILMFTLFRFHFKGYRKQIALTAVILSYVSYTMRMDGIEGITIIVQFILIFLLVWLLFQVQVFYAAIMSFTAYFGYGLIQGLLVLFSTEFGILQTSDITENSLKGYVFQLASAILYSLIGWIIRKKNKGFDFVPTTKYARVRFTKLNLFFLLVLISSTLGLSFVFYVSNNYRSIEDIIILVIIFVVTVSALLFLSSRKEWEDG